MAYNFTQRLTCPQTPNKFYTKNTISGGLSDTIYAKNKIQWVGSTIPNCVGLAAGRFNEVSSEIRGKDGWYWKNLNSTPVKNVERAKKKGLICDTTPYPGSMLVWKPASGSGGGHVAFVEDMLSDGRLVIVESSYSGAYIWRKRIVSNKDKNWNGGKSYKFYCFIHNPDVKEIQLKPTEPVERDKTVDQLEILSSTLRVRTGASTSSKIIGHAKPGIYNYYEIKKDKKYTWYRIADDQWVAYGKSYMKIYPAEQLITFAGGRCWRSKNGSISLYLKAGEYKITNTDETAAHPIQVLGKYWINQ